MSKDTKPAQPARRRNRVKLFPFPAGCDVSTLAIRETDGVDEAIASEQVEARGRTTTTTTLELLALAVVAIDGKRVPTDTPCYAFETWSSRTRAFAVQAFESLNGVLPSEVATFFGAAEWTSMEGPFESTASRSGADTSG